MEMKKYLKKKNELRYCFKNMADENISQEFRLKNIVETRNCFLKEIEQNKLMCKSTERFIQL